MADSASGQTIEEIVAKAVGLPPPAAPVPSPQAASKPKAEPAEVESDAGIEGDQSLDVEPAQVQAPEEKSPAPAAKQGSDALEKLRATARLGGIPEETLAGMSEQALRAFAGSASKGTRYADRVSQENAELKRQLEEAKQAAATKEPLGGPAAVADVLDPQLVEEIGEQGARALNALVAKKIAEREAALHAEAEQAKAQDEQVRAIFTAMQDAGEFQPGLPGYEQVKEKALALSQAGGLYAGLAGEERARAIFRDAAKLLAASVPSSPEPAAEEKPPAKTATVTRVPQRTTRQAPANGSPDAAVDRMIGAVLRGERDPVAIARKFG